MSSQPHNRFGSTLAISLVGILLYLLSIGPAVWLYTHSGSSGVQRFLDRVYWIYWPIDLLHSEAPEPVPALLDWYVELWEGP